MTEQIRIARLTLMGLVVVLGALALSLSLMTGRAGAQAEPYSSATPSIAPTRIVVQHEDPTEPGAVLPFTGADLSLFAATGVAAIATGAFVLRRARR